MERKHLTLRIAAGLLVVLAIVTIPILVYVVDGWRKLAAIPMIYPIWQFANYAFSSKSKIVNHK
jgi:hypothetical protein